MQVKGRMASPTGSSTSPVQRPLPSDHNTSDLMPRRVCSQMKEKTGAAHISRQHHLNNCLSTIKSTHRKGLRKLSQRHRKSVEMSMLAYSQKVRKISSERLMIAAPPEQYGASDVGQYGSKFADHSRKKLPRNLLVPVRSRHPKSDVQKRKTNISVDSWIDITKADQKQGRKKNSDFRHLPEMLNLASQGPLKPRLCSFDMPELNSSLDQDNLAAGQMDKFSDTSREQRYGTTNNSDIPDFSFKITNETPESDNGKNSASPDELSDAALAIIPFPEFRLSAFKDQAEETESLEADEDNEDKDKGQGALQTSANKFLNTRENYWSYRNMHRRRHSIATTYHCALNKLNFPLQDEVLSLRLGASVTASDKAKPDPETKVYHRLFRYSIAVDSFAKSLASSQNKVDENDVIRKASEILPTLDLLELNHGRKPVKQKEKVISKETTEQDV